MRPSIPPASPPAVARGGLRARFAAIAAALAAMVLDRPVRPAGRPVHGRKARLDGLSDHLRRDIGFPPGSPFS